MRKGIRRDDFLARFRNSDKLPSGYSLEEMVALYDMRRSSPGDPMHGQNYVHSLIVKPSRDDDGLHAFVVTISLCDSLKCTLALFGCGPDAYASLLKSEEAKRIISRSTLRPHPTVPHMYIATDAMIATWARR